MSSAQITSSCRANSVPQDAPECLASLRINNKITRVLHSRGGKNTNQCIRIRIFPPGWMCVGMFDVYRFAFTNNPQLSLSLWCKLARNPNCCQTTDLKDVGGLFSSDVSSALTTVWLTHRPISLQCWPRYMLLTAYSFPGRTRTYELSALHVLIYKLCSLACTGTPYYDGQALLELRALQTISKICFWNLWIVLSV